MPDRTPEDLLREECFALLPDMRRVVEEVEAKVRQCLLPLSTRLDRYERLVVKSRVKDCESALAKLRKGQEGRIFDSGRTGSYRLTGLVPSSDTTS
jgi:ppGpp synthetase/RelA/SpoT-type nucleotidyltranferase